MKVIKSLIYCVIFLLLNLSPNIYAVGVEKHINVPCIKQDSIVSGCEAVSATMLLKFYSYDISKEDFTDKYLIKKDWTVVDGKRYGPDPNSAYPGDPYIASGLNCGYGCYSPCVAKSMNKFLEQSAKDKEYPKHIAKAICDISLQDVVEKYIDNDMPVLLWVTMNMKTVKKGDKWIIDFIDENSCNKIGDKFTWTSGEHCVVLVGYSKDGYLINDPKNGVILYNKDEVDASYKALGSQIVVLENKTIM